MEIEIKKFNDVWLDNGLSTFIGILKGIEADDEDRDIIDGLTVNSEAFRYRILNKQEFIKSLSSEIISKIRNLVVKVEDKDTGEEKEVKKEYVLIQEGRKIGGKVALKENIFDATKTKEIITSIYDNLEDGKKRCFFCGRKFVSNIKKLQQASYPFVTKIKSLSGIRSGRDIKLTEYISDICPHCYLLGILEWLDSSLIYRSIPAMQNIIIIPQMDSIKDLIKLKSSYSGILNNEKRWSNIKVDVDKSEVENPSGKYSTLISFYENLIRNVQPDKKADHWFIIEIPAGSVKNPKYFEIKFDESILNLFHELIFKQKCLFYREFVKSFYAFYDNPQNGIRDFDKEHILHEQLCQAITENNFNVFRDAFLPRKGIHIGIPKDTYKILEKIIKIWRLQRMNEANRDKFLEIIKSAGNSIASLIGNRVSLFFKLEKSKNSSELLKILQSITRRLTIDKDQFETNYEKFKGLNENEKRKIQYINTYNLDKLIEAIVESEDNRKLFEDTKNIMLIYASLRMGKLSNDNQEQKNEQEN